MKLSIPGLLVGVCAAVVPQSAAPVEADWSLKLRLGGLVEGERDLGISEGQQEGTEIGYLDANGSLLLKYTPDFSSYVRLQGYAPSGEVFQEEDGRSVQARGFGALRELWFEYGGVTTYPGEVIRLGLQRVRDPDGLWWDRDIESLRWIFDTTLLQSHIGVAQQFNSYRTDDVELAPSQEDRPYLIAGLGGQWLPGHFIGVRGTYAGDRTDEEDYTPTGAMALDPTLKNRERRYGWLGGYLHNGYYDYDAPPIFAYWLEAVLLTGSREAARVDNGPDPLNPAPMVVREETDVRAFGGDIGMRLRFGDAPFLIGAAYAFGQGGSDSDSGRDETFQQTGLESNRSRFTGTRSLLYRFNEALHADLSNLKVASAFMAIPLQRFDASLVYHKFDRHDPTDPIDADGINQPNDPFFPLPLIPGEKDIGRGIDLAMAVYFGQSGATSYGWGEDLRNNVRLRGSVFQPGDAFGTRPDGTELDDQYRAILELTWWF